MAAKKVTRATKNGDSTAGYERVAVDDLFFDAKNPRLVEHLDGEKPSQDALLAVLWQQMAVDELAMSIAASGYFDYEPLFASEENKQLGRFLAERDVGVPEVISRARLPRAVLQHKHARVILVAASRPERMRFHRAEAFGENRLRSRRNGLLSKNQDQVIEKRLADLPKRCFAQRTR